MKFHPTDPDNIPFEALKYLSSSLEEDRKISDVLSEARRGEGTIFVIESDKIVGALYLQLFPGVLNIVHLGAESMNDLKEDLPKFIKQTMTECGVENLLILSRKGWHRVFKDLTPVGMLYTYNQ